ncbi:MAG: gas vesicle protein [Bacteroidetes bacterium GWF2_42_66]|nr:MAG: gas vesicle protein [Bacteroidetes bacterium GWA2_42_15]OFX97514.1 MAG: gas vesicle protein [Bacteroidetes bacterium GWE2_42_39]OFY43792.1 MAG: gas vesicle protein [Bacteroidetes bacterium GWF2_42_66]HBL76229.1 gas vesicle protein [Prolixibacteraceae bacterium]HCR89283.1 gas vesicle protein [Prolixibacteraceae bacterium]
MSSGKVVLGVLAGLAAGALAGILFAPAKGSRTRKRIAKKGKDYADGLKDIFNEFVEDITEKFEQVKEEVSEFAEEKMGKQTDTKDGKTARS